MYFVPAFGEHLVEANMDKRSTHITLGFLGILGFLGQLTLACIPSSKQQATPLHWEYKFLYESAAPEDVKLANGIQVPEDDLNVLGKSGWELTTSYLEVETVFPNLGDPKYITGVQSNVRPKRAVFVLKRPLP